MTTTWSAILTSCSMITAVIAVVTGSGFLLFLSRRRQQQQQRQRQTTDNDSSSGGGVPCVPGGLPLLGHALQYKSNPVQFLLQQEQVLNSPVFVINLAGRKMTVITGSTMVQQISRLPETIVSSKQAIKEIGWEYIKGPFGWKLGSSFRKRFLKTRMYADGDKYFNSHFLRRAWIALHRAFQVEMMETGTANILKEKDKSSSRLVAEVDDLFQFTRRCTLRAMIECLLGTAVADAAGDRSNLLELLLDYETTMEQTLRVSFMFPKVIALPFFLLPCAYKRRRLTSVFVQCIEEAVAEEAFAKDDENDDDNDDNGRVGPLLRIVLKDGTPFNVAVELILGLLFQRNSSIAASQSFCYLQELSASDDSGDVVRLRASKEAAALLEASGLATPHQQHHSSLSASPAAGVKMNTGMLLHATTLRRCILETMRLSAHPIGGVRQVHRSFVVTASKTGKKYKILPGDTIAISHISTHMNRDLWGDSADRFFLDRPEYDDGGDDTNNTCPRSRNNNKKKKEGRNSSCPASSLSMAVPVDEYKFMTFSHGIHKCPGEKIALAVAEMILALLLLHDAKPVNPQQRHDDDEERERISSSGTTSRELPGVPSFQLLPPVKYLGSTLSQRDGPVPVSLKLRSF